MNTTTDVKSEAHEPRKLTVAENAILTVKVLAGFGVLGAGLWAAGVQPAVVKTGLVFGKDWFLPELMTKRRNVLGCLV